LTIVFVDPHCTRYKPIVPLELDRQLRPEYSLTERFSEDSRNEAAAKTSHERPERGKIGWKEGSKVQEQGVEVIYK
jgi:hypothetical protein